MRLWLTLNEAELETRPSHEPVPELPEQLAVMKNAFARFAFTLFAVTSGALFSMAHGQTSPAEPKPTQAAASPTSIPAAIDCKSHQHTILSRFWELESASDCGTLGIRGYHPTSLSLIGPDGANTQPASSAPGHTSLAPIAYSPTETRIQLSVRTKIAQGLLTQGHPNRNARDSLWFGYTQQSYWQLFNSDLSRPFRTTDHEPEITHIYPTDAALPGGWRLRYSGLSLVHQSNGQSPPLSRSWNRTALMAGMEQGGTCA